MTETQTPYTTAGPDILPAPCPRCGGRKPRYWSICAGCALHIDTDDLARMRDELSLHLEREGAWLLAADQYLSAMPLDDPRQARGKAIWTERLAAYERTARNYRALCWATPEVSV